MYVRIYHRFLTSCDEKPQSRKCRILASAMPIPPMPSICCPSQSDHSGPHTTILYTLTHSNPPMPHSKGVRCAVVVRCALAFFLPVLPRLCTPNGKTYTFLFIVLLDESSSNFFFYSLFLNECITITSIVILCEEDKNG